MLSEQIRSFGEPALVFLFLGAARAPVASEANRIEKVNFMIGMKRIENMIYKEKLVWL